MRFYLFAIVVLTAVVFPVSVSAKDEVILAANGVEVTETDVINFVRLKSENIDLDTALARPNALLRVVEDTYVVKRLAQQGLDAGVMSLEDATWLTEDQIRRRQMRAYLTAEAAKVMENADWEQAAEEKYLADPELFSTGEQLGVSHILISIDGQSFSEVAERVMRVEQRLAAGDEFSVVAVEESDDPSVATNEGNLGTVGRGQTHPAFEAAAYVLQEVGDVSPPVLTSFGIHFIRLNEKITPTRPDFSIVKNLIIDDLKLDGRTEIRQSIVNATRLEVGGAEINFDEAALLAELKKELK